MLLKQDTLSRIADGSVTLAYRRWKRPTVKAGGTLVTPVGQLRILAVDPVGLEDIGEVDARAAGWDDLGALRAELTRRSAGEVYRIAFELAGPDPRIALRQEVPEGDELQALVARVRRWAWAEDALRLISERPAVRAADLAGRMSMGTSRFKANVRRLKGLGLTESLEIGYRLSPRGEAVLKGLERDAD